MRPGTVDKLLKDKIKLFIKIHKFVLKFANPTDQQLGQSVAHSDGGVSVSLTEFWKILDGLAADLKERWMVNLSGISKKRTR